MNNIIFLDIDGVLNNSIVIFNEESVNALKELVMRYNAKVVMITSWQGNGTVNIRKRIEKRMEQLGIYDIDFIDPNYEGYILDIKLPNRLLGIIDYLKNNDIDNYVILDDEYYRDYKLVCLNHYRTKMFKGLKYNDLNKIILKPINYNNFKYINYQYRELGNHELVTNNLIKVLKKMK
jgi:hypothetical protein